MVDRVTALLDEHGESVYSFCQYVAKNKQDGEDLFQQTFLRALEIASRIDNNKNPKSYLFSIAVNLWKNTIQKRARRNRITQPVDADNSNAWQLEDCNVNIETDVINKMMNVTLLEIVNKLDDKHRIPVILHYSEDMKLSEIASVLGKPEGTIKRLLHEAKKKIKKEMEAMGYE